MSRVSVKSCKFCQIAGGEAPAHIVYENAETIAFLDYRPLFPGHVLLIPKDHVGVLPDLPAELVEPLFSTAKMLSKAVQAALGAQGTFVAINNNVSQSVPHLHIHIVPRVKGDGLKGFFWPRNDYRNEDHRKEVRDKIIDAIPRSTP